MYSSSGDIEIGATLRKARQDSGATLEDVEQETKIRKRYLEALEREDYDQLPNAVYARGFLKTYANYLGLDGDELSRELKERWETVQERQLRESLPKESRLERRPRIRSGRAGAAGMTFGRRSRISPVAVLGLVLALALLAAAVGGLYWVGQSSRGTGGEQPPERRAGEPPGDGRERQSGSGVAPGGGTTAADGGTVVGGPTTVEAPSAGVIRLTVLIEREPAWLSVRADGNLLYEQIAQPGYSQVFEAGERITVWTGNAGAVRLEVNGQDYGALGAPGEVKRRTFTLKAAEE